MTLLAHVYPPGLGGHTERVPKILSFSMDRFEGGGQKGVLDERSIFFWVTDSVPKVLTFAWDRFGGRRSERHFRE